MRERRERTETRQRRNKEERRKNIVEIREKMIRDDNGKQEEEREERYV